MFVEEPKRDQKSRVLKFGYLPVMVKGSNRSKAFSQLTSKALSDPVDTEEEAIEVIRENMETKAKYMGWQYLNEFTMSMNNLISSNGNATTFTFRVIQVVLDWN